MKNKICAIIGVLCFIAAVAIGQFFNFAASNIVTIALAAFGLASTIYATVEAQKEAENLNWKTWLIIALSVIAGVLVFIGGLTSSIFEQLSGLVVAIIAIILGIFAAKK